VKNTLKVELHPALVELHPALQCQLALSPSIVLQTVERVCALQMAQGAMGTALASAKASAEQMSSDRAQAVSDNTLLRNTIGALQRELKHCREFIEAPGDAAALRQATERATLAEAQVANSKAQVADLKAQVADLKTTIALQASRATNDETRSAALVAALQRKLSADIQQSQALSELVNEKLGSVKIVKSQLARMRWRWSAARVAMQARAVASSETRRSLQQKLAVAAQRCAGIELVEVRKCALESELQARGSELDVERARVNGLEVELAQARVQEAGHDMTHAAAQTCDSLYASVLAPYEVRLSPPVTRPSCAIFMLACVLMAWKFTHECAV
jgi:chromosome segregation ATPase